MDLVAVPTVERGHDGHDARFNCRQITLPVNGHQIVFAQARVTLIDTAVRAAITDEVLCRGNNALGLHRLDNAAGKIFHQNRIRAIGLIRPAPPGVQCHCQRRRKNPINTRGADFSRSRPCNRRGQLRVTDRTQRDVVGKYRGADDIVMTVHRIGTPNNRNTGTACRGVDRRQIVGICKIHPILNRSMFVLSRKRPSAVQDAPQAVHPDILGRHVLDFTLNHLRHFLLKRERRQQRFDTTIDVSSRVRLPNSPKAQHNNRRHRACTQIHPTRSHHITDTSQSR